MKALKIKPEIINELNKRTMVVCTYIDKDGNPVDCISVGYKKDFPDLEEIEVYTSREQYEIMQEIKQKFKEELIDELEVKLKKYIPNISSKF